MSHLLNWSRSKHYCADFFCFSPQQPYRKRFTQRRQNLQKIAFMLSSLVFLDINLYAGTILEDETDQSERYQQKWGTKTSATQRKPAPLESNHGQSILNLRKVYQLAFDRNSQWQAQQAKSKADQQVQDLAFSQLLPQITAEINYAQTQYQFSQQEITACFADLAFKNVLTLDVNNSGQIECRLDPKTKNATFDTTTATLSLNQALVRLPKWYAFQSGQILRRKALLDLEIAKQTLMLKAGELYLNRAKTSQLLKQQQQQQHTLQQILTAKQQGYENGTVSSSDLIENQAQLDLIKTTVLQAQLAVDNAEDDLSSFIQKPIAPTPDQSTVNQLTINALDVDDANVDDEDGQYANISERGENIPLATPRQGDLDRWLLQALQENLDMKSARATVQASRFHYLAEQMRHAPSLDLVGQYNQTRADANTSAYSSSQSSSTTIGLTLSMPLYSGGYLSANRTQAKFQSKEALWSLTQLQQALQSQIRKQVRTLEILALQAKQQRNALASHQKALSAITQGYRNGIRHAADVFKVQMDILTIKRNHTETQYEFIMASLQLKQLLGVLSESDLATVDEWLK